MPTLTRIADRQPTTDAARIVANLRPPRQFDGATFESYVTDPAHPSQAHAVERMQELATVWRGGGRKGLFRKAPQVKPGIYLDGGFGVGKTHLLASLWHAVEGPKAFGTFVEYTNLVGAMSFRKAVDALRGYRLVCIDEFELDDPGDTVMMSRLMRELSDAGVKLAATSNTLPGSLGEGRFAAVDFKREIQVLADQFDVVRIDGEDYRHRGLPAAPAPMGDDAVMAAADAAAERGATVACDDVAALVEHLSRVHPSRYRQLIDGIDVVVWRGVQTITRQDQALRFVVLADRLYDKDVPIISSGEPLDRLFSEEMMGGGYMKKYFRAVSRLTALAREGGQA